MEVVTSKTPRVTFESVAAVAESIRESGGRPSVRGVMKVIGGSPNDISPHLQAWKVAGQPRIEAPAVALDPQIINILSLQIAREIAAATAEQKDRVKDLEADLGDVAEAGRLAEARAEELAGELVHVQNDNQQQAGRLDAQAQEMERLKQDTAASVAEARTDAAREREAGEHVRQALARAELRLEAVPAMEAALADLRAQLDAEREARTGAEKAAAVAEAERHAAELRAGDLRESLEHARAELRGQQAQAVALQAEAGEARQVAAMAREEAASLRGQVVPQSGIDSQPAPAAVVPTTTRAKKTTPAAGATPTKAKPKAK